MKRQYEYDITGLMGWLITNISRDFRVTTMREVGQICSVCPSQLSRWVNGRVKPTWDAVINMLMEANQEAVFQKMDFQYELTGMPPQLVKKALS